MTMLVLTAAGATFTPAARGLSGPRAPAMGG